ncbi:MAG: hypothetical protein CVV24_03345 [Ignavibacteriae bacterium HGW-Ignavibacteriae-3]|nr:MAG: hypothetical protein CVV24_03345 [Ignavibacteriae bacterium HGW-Ignavibacteriae-3]
MDVIQVLLILLIISSSALCIFTIYYLRKMSRQVEDVIRDFQELIQKTNPVIENLEQISYRANRVVSEVEGYWREIDGAIKNIRERISGLTSLRNLHDVEYPAKDLIKKIKALAKGASAFWNAFKQR